MGFDPASANLSDLFRDPDMFDSPDDWRDAGFDLLRASDDKICVASHRSVPGYLFKKYVLSGKRDTASDQLENYQTRLEGAQLLQQLQHVVVPGKWRRELPRAFNLQAQTSHIMIVDRFDLMDGDESERAYSDISPEVLRDLCVTLYAFRGLDSNAKNVPFTTDGKIAFIDTEHWNRHADRKKKDQRPWLKYLGPHLSSTRKRQANEIWKSLDGGGAADDFSDEESTSSSSPSTLSSPSS